MQLSRDWRFAHPIQNLKSKIQNALSPKTPLRRLALSEAGAAA
jgi:hypothetical protein